MKVLIISGFLGAGKTTFIKSLAQKTKRDFVVLENEYGDTDIDSKSLKMDAKLDVYELTQGCVCCTMKQDFASSILTICNTLDPEILIVEPTGLAKLSNILNNIKKIQYEKIVLLNPITILDGKNFDSYINEYKDYFLDQINNSTQIVISKMENALDSEINDLKKRISKISKDSQIITNHYSTMDDKWWNLLLDDYLDPKYKAIACKDNVSFDSIALRDVSIDSFDKLITFMHAVTSGVFGNVVRGKGYISCDNEILRFDIVNSTYAITGVQEQDYDENDCIFIGENLEKSWFRQVLQSDFYRENNQ